MHFLFYKEKTVSLEPLPKSLLVSLLLYMYELYSVCASLLCKSQKMMKQNKKDDEALQREEKTWWNSDH